jgi:hypothetical protein
LPPLYSAPRRLMARWHHWGSRGLTLDQESPASNTGCTT